MGFSGLESIPEIVENMIVPGMKVIGSFLLCGCLFYSKNVDLGIFLGRCANDDQYISTQQREIISFFAAQCRFRRIDLLKIARLITMILLGNRKAGRLSFLPAFIM